MKICELKIQSSEDRSNLVKILANAGYKVSIEERRVGVMDKDYFVVVENDWSKE